MRLRPCLLLTALACLPSVAFPKEPPNLGQLKQEIRTYVESGEYTQDMATVATEAMAWLRERAPQGGGRLAVVLDLDDTLLSNWPELSRLDLTLDRKLLPEWYEAAQAPVIEPTREIYRLARQLGVAVIYITGRLERFRAVTECNLQDVGCADYAELILRPADWKDTGQKFKAAERERLTAAGYVIIANVGDQAADLAGGFAEKTFKLPNPFYLSK